jgi:lambda repressor-like predicted transcriptional regulator
MAKNIKEVSDEEIIAALVQNGTVKDAAAVAGISPRTIYDRMKNPAFRGDYMAAKTDIIRAAVFSINGKLSEAVDAVAEIMNDKAVNPAVRLQAAQTIINNAAKFASRLSGEESASREESSGLWSFG